MSELTILGDKQDKPKNADYLGEMETKTPEVLTLAAKRAGDLLTEDDLTPEQRQAVWDQRAKPYLDAAKKRRQDIEREQFGGLRYWRGIEGDYTQADQEYERQIAQDVTAPLLLADQELKLKKIATAQDAGLALSGAQLQRRQQGVSELESEAKATGNYLGDATLDSQDLALRAKEQAEASAARKAGLTGKLGTEETLAYQEFQESKRQFNVEQQRVVDQFAQQFGLSRDEFLEKKRQFDAGIALDDARLEESIRQFNRQSDQAATQFQATQTQNQAQFDARLKQEADQFLKSTGLSQAQLDEAIAARKAGNELQNRQLQVAVDQFTATQEQRKAEFAATTALQKAELLGYMGEVVSAKDFGVDTASYLNADGSVKDYEKFFQAADVFANSFKQVYGRELTDNEAVALARGQEIGIQQRTLSGVRSDLEVAGVTGTYDGNPTAQMVIAQMPYVWQQKVAQGWDYTDANGRTQHVYGSQEWATMDRQNAARVAVAGFDMVDPATGRQIHVAGAQELAKEDWARSEKTRNGYTEVVTDINGQPVRQPGTGQVVTRQVMGTGGLQKYQIDLEADLRRQGLSQEAAQQAAALDLEEKKLTGFYSVVRDPITGNPMVGPGGRPVTKWVEGSASLEKQRLDSQVQLTQMNIDANTAARVAEQEYQDKVREGYWGVGQDGSPAWVRGAQSDQEYLLKLQQEFQVDQASAERLWQEQQRVGYDKVVTIQTPTGPRSATMHIQGTQEATVAAQRRQEQLTRDGWGADAARDQQAFENAQRAKTGYFGADGKWVQGDRQFQAETLDKQIAAQTLADTTAYQRQLFIQERAHTYEQSNMSKQEAYAKAAREWQSGEAVLDRANQMLILDKQNATAQERIDAENKLALLSAGITAIGGITGKGVDVLLQHLFPGGSVTAGALESLPALLGAPLTWTRMGYGQADAEKMAKMFTDRVAGQGANGVSVAVGSGQFDGLVGAPNAGSGTGTAAPSGNVVARFGNWATGGAAGTGAMGTLAGAGIIAGGIYLGYQVFKGIKAESQEKKDFDSWYGSGEVSTDTAAKFRAELTRGDVSWGERGDVFEAMKEAQALREQGKDISQFGEDDRRTQKGLVRRRARDLVLKMDEWKAAETTQAVSNLRGMIDKGLFASGANPDNMSVGDERTVDQTWGVLPAAARSKPANQATIQDKLKDLANFGAELDVMGTQELRTSMDAFVASAGSKLDGLTSADNLTRGERAKINAFWIQSGGDPRADLLTQAKGLRGQAAKLAGGGTQTGGTGNQGTSSGTSSSVTSTAGGSGSAAQSQSTSQAQPQQSQPTTQPVDPGETAKNSGTQNSLALPAKFDVGDLGLGGSPSGWSYQVQAGPNLATMNAGNSEANWKTAIRQRLAKVTGQAPASFSDAVVSKLLRGDLVTQAEILNHAI